MRVDQKCSPNESAFNLPKVDVGVESEMQRL